jgi:protein-L-isoaspartate(D-aspartate) O-methyltransferase
MHDFCTERQTMVREQLVPRGIADPRVLDAMRGVPRDQFVEPSMRALAYADEPLDIGEGQTISQPYIVAKMVQEARLECCDNVLEVGTGSGYAAAVAAVLCRDVYTVERYYSLAAAAEERLARLGYLNVHVQHGDGSVGWEEHAPYDAILVPAAPVEIPPLLLDQLAVGGRMVIPVGARWVQQLVRITREGKDDYRKEPLELVQFVPLLPGVRGHAAA